MRTTFAPSQRWARPGADAASGTLPSRSRAINVPSTVMSGAGRPPPGTQARSSDPIAASLPIPKLIVRGRPDEGRSARAPVPSGSWLALSHPARDIHPQGVTEAASRFNQLAPAKATLRTRAEILRLFDGLELLDPGLVQVHQWRPGMAAPGHYREAAGYCGLARKP
jgi:S-adenosyl methyltransferase